MDGHYLKQYRKNNKKEDTHLWLRFSNLKSNFQTGRTVRRGRKFHSKIEIQNHLQRSSFTRVCNFEKPSWSEDQFMGRKREM